MVLARIRKSYLGSAVIASCVFLVSFRKRRRKVSPRFHLFGFDLDQGNEETG